MQPLLHRLIVGAAFIFSLYPRSNSAAPISEQQASNAVLRATALHYPATASSPKLFHTPFGFSQRNTKRVDRMVHENQVVGYAVALEPSGYYLVATDDEIPPWKLRSDEGNLDDLPPGLLAVLKLEMAEDRQALAQFRKMKQAVNPKFRKQWQSLTATNTQSEGDTNAPTTSAGSFLLATTWNQGTPYNYYCPAASGGPDSKAWAGCTAAALAQILRYHNQPNAVALDKTYTDSSGSCQGTHSISDAGMGAYNWASLPNSIDSGSPVAQQQAVGQLMYHAAVALESDFEAGGTGASPSIVPSVYRTYFSYACDNLEWKSSYTSSQWYDKIAADIDANKPVFYAMWQSDWTAGHAVVCDGYQNGNEIHINLGWSGSGNAWYNIDSINYAYTWTIHSAVFGITPPNGGGLPAPILNAEPQVTPGTQNTIYWSTVQASGGSAVVQNASVAVSCPDAVGSELQHTFSSSTYSPLSPASPVEVVLGADKATVEAPAVDNAQQPVKSPGTAKGKLATTRTSHVQEPVSHAAIENQQQGLATILPENEPAPSSAMLSADLPNYVAAPAEDKGAAPAPLFAWQGVFGETFEGAFPGSSWTLYGNPTWDDTSYSAHSGSWSGWCGDSAIAPSGGYANNMNAWMVYGPFSLADAVSARVNFWFKNYSEANFDYFKWYASTNGVNFYGQQVSGDQSTWRSQTFDLSNVYTIGNLCGKGQVWIAFVFSSDSSVSGPGYTGAYVDDVVIEKDVVNRPDLTPYQPGYWNSKIPIGTNQLAYSATHNYGGPYYDNQTLYVNWGSLNQGNASAPGYTVRVEVTGTGGGVWTWSGLTTDVNYWTHLNNDIAVGPLSAGTHTFKVWVDYNGNVTESNEGNNYYERTITVGASAKPDLTPYQHPNWNDKIPIGTNQLSYLLTHNYSGPYYDNQTLYFNWGALNQGNATASGFTVHVEVAGTGGGSWNWQNLNLDAGYRVYLTDDLAVGPLSVGTHTFKVWVDYTDNVSESSEGNNYYERTIAVLSGARPDLTPYLPGNWNDRMPVGTNQLGFGDAHNYTGPYYDNQTLYFNWGMVNQGNASASGFTVQAEVTGIGGGSWSWQGLTSYPGNIIYLTLDQLVGPLSAGTHTFRFWVDSNNNVTESNEGNNYYERTITVQTALIEYYAECADNPNFVAPQYSGWIRDTQCTFSNLTPGQTNWYRVKACRGSQVSAWASVVHSQQEPLPVTPVGPNLKSPMFANGSFSFSVQTESGKRYVLQYTDRLPATQWTDLVTITGDGSNRVVSDPGAAAAPQRFYRVRVE